MTAKTLCRYHMNGCCRYGHDCKFSHDMKDMPSTVCTYYLAGNCAYGVRCRYDHVRPKAAEQTRPGPGADDRHAPAAASSQPVQGAQSSRGRADAAWDGPPHGAASTARSPTSSSSHRLPSNGPASSTRSSEPLHLRRLSPHAAHFESSHHPQPPTGQYAPPVQQSHSHSQRQQQQQPAAETQQQWASRSSAGPALNHQSYQPPNSRPYAHNDRRPHDTRDLPSRQMHQHPEHQASPKSPPPDHSNFEEQFVEDWNSSDGYYGDNTHPYGEYYATAACPKGEACKLVHGLACPICHNHSLHPYNEEAQASHLQECHSRHERLAARARSAVKECGICLERVLEKEVPRERRFGLLSGCFHAFCLPCIRGWRSHLDSGADVDGALRTCPVCRTTSYYVIPSPVWPADQADKERIVGEYKSKLSSIDCRHWNFGENACPFGTSCFYRHVYPDGRPQETRLRKYGNSEGEVKIVRPVNLSQFMDLPQAQRAMHAHLT
ncbi:hypothetical protein WJX84_010899 [Apatococcus fuscideae]|uniref:RING-type E3 ubiquitin transferase n=1 Tax=Apatococcus fuscideae TaxID=2026836 RepID=A0AAW1SXX1_9CHLO